MKFDIYESFENGEGEHICSKEQINQLFSKEELHKMCNLGEEIRKGKLKYWAEEAIIYSNGIKL